MHRRSAGRPSRWLQQPRTFEANPASDALPSDRRRHSPSRRRPASQAANLQFNSHRRATARPGRRGSRPAAECTECELSRRKAQAAAASRESRRPEGVVRAQVTGVFRRSRWRAAQKRKRPVASGMLVFHRGCTLSQFRKFPMEKERETSEALAPKRKWSRRRRRKR